MSGPWEKYQAGAPAVASTGVDDSLLDAVRQVESGGNPRAVSSAGAVGAYQFMPGTARQFGIDPRDEGASRAAAGKYLAQLQQQFGDPRLALTAYNWGPGNLAAYLKTGKGLRGQEIPEEARQYADKVLAARKPGMLERGADAVLSAISGEARAAEAPPMRGPWERYPQATGAAPAGGPWSRYQKQEAPSDVPDPTEGNSFLKNATIGAGKFFVDTSRGVRQALGIGDQKALQQEIDDAKRLDAPLMQTVGGKVGNIGAAALTAAPAMFIPGASTVAGSALVGAGSAALAPVATGESRAENALIGGAGGALGQGAVNTVGRLIRPVRGAPVTGELSTLIGAAQNRGIPLSAGQVTRSRPLLALESTMRDMPFTAGRAEAFRQGQQSAFNRQIASTFGENADNLSPEVLGRARDRLGGIFRDVSSRNTVTLDRQLENVLANVEATNAQAGPLASGRVNDVVEWLRNAGRTTPAQQVPTGVLDAAGRPIMTMIPGRQAAPMAGEQYQTIRSILSRNSKDAYQSGNSQLGGALRDLRNALDDAAERSIRPADQQAWQAARRQYGNLKTIEKAVKNDGSGEAFPARLASSVRQASPNAFLYGQGDTELATLAKIGNGLLKDSTPNSGTAQRQFWRDLLNGSMLNAGAQLGKGAAGFAVGVPLQRIMQTQAGQTYLTRGLLDQTPAMLVARRAGNGLASGAGGRLLGLLND